MSHYSLQNQSLVKEVVLQEHNKSNDINFSSSVEQRLYSSLTKFFNCIFRELNLLGKNLQTEHIYEFFELKKRSPVMSDSGVTNDTTLIWLYALTKFIDPEIIVESGVYLGKSLWMLRQAAPNAEIHAYDISLKQLRFTDDTIPL